MVNMPPLVVFNLGAKRCVSHTGAYGNFETPGVLSKYADVAIEANNSVTNFTAK